MNSTSLIAEATILAEVNKGVGVIIAVIGAIVVSPAGWRAILQSSAAWVRAQTNRVRGIPPQPLQMSAMGSAEIFGNATLTTTTPPLPPDRPVAEQVTLLYSLLRSVDGRLNQLMSSLADDRNARDKQISDLATVLETGLQELDGRVTEQERESARVDARGLPVIAFGIVLSGIPEWLAAMPLHLGWAFPLAGLLVTGKVLGSSRRSSA